MAYRSVSSTTTTGGTTITGSAPAGTAAADVLTASLTFSVTPGVIGVPAGWTEVTASGAGLLDRFRLFKAAGTASDFTWTWAGGSAALVITAHSGRSGVVTAIAEYTDATGATITAPTTTAASGDDLVLSFNQGNGASAFGTSPSPAGTVRADINTAAGGSNVLVATVDALSSGATGAYTCVGTGSFNARQGFQILLPASGGGGAPDSVSTCFIL